MLETFGLFTAFTLGLFGSPHCFGMCGGICAAVGMTADASASLARRFALLSLCGFARVSSYIFLGAGAGALANLANNYRASMLGLRLVSALMLVLMGLYLSGVWPALAWLERLGAKLFNPTRTMAASTTSTKQVPGIVSLGLAWGLLPCGLVYSALAWSASSGSSLESALRMAAFGLGTFPAVLAMGIGASHIGRVLQQTVLRCFVGSLIIAFGIWTAAAAVTHSLHSPMRINPPDHHSIHAH